MKVKIKMNKAVLRQLDNALGEALEQTVDAVKTEATNKLVIPFDVGTLQESMQIDASKKNQGHMSIVIGSPDTPYARRLYFHPEYDFKKDKNPNAQGRWFDPWIDGEYKDFPQKTFNKLYKRITGV